jgi:hypothetical protein
MTPVSMARQSSNSDGADREPPSYPALHEFNPSIRCGARSRSRRLILFSLIWLCSCQRAKGGRGEDRIALLF